jgi:ATP-dependent DNA helicase RecG
MLSLKEAIAGIHYPDSFEHVEKSRIRLAFNEIFFLQYYISFSRKLMLSKKPGLLYNYNTTLMNDFISSLPFKLTDEQQQALDDIKQDIVSTLPMNRLLQGDVGTGKTILALSSALLPVSAGRQAALMVPTEILASQHFQTAQKYLPSSIKCALLTGSMKKKEKESVYDSILSGDIDILIGTHSLIQGELKFRDLAYIIIDEQHRFGVEQRAKLRSKGENTDLLVMTATPIPRSLSMTLYADMDLSSIRGKPFNREAVETLAFPESRLKGVYNSMSKYIEQGRQIFYVLPLIEESEKADLKSAEETFLLLKEKIFPHFRVALIHGRLPQVDKDTIMDSFRSGETDILVSTTVIEVGIDIPNANVIIIHHAERFGLAQIHQLRGRVGRGEHKSFCILIYPDKISSEAGERIKILTENSDGFAISELDLQMRGSGQLVGTRQHGVSDFEFTDLTRDIDIILSAKKEAESVLGIHSGNADYDKTHFAEITKNMRSKRILSILS